MMKSVMTIVLVAMLAVSSNPAAIMAAVVAAKSAGAESSSVSSWNLFLDKTWTTWGQENVAGSQVLAVSSLTSTVSFSAEGMGLEPTTPCGAPHFQCGR